MLATRTNQEHLDSSYVSETKMKSIPESCSSKRWMTLQQRNEKERFLEIKVEPKSNENLSKVCERECESE